MLHILLLILKIILWVILAIIGLILLLVLILLFAPISYKADIDYKDKAKVKAKVKFLMVSVNILFDQENKVNDQIIRIFGIKLGGRKKQDGFKKTKVVSDEEAKEDEIFDNLSGTETNNISSVDNTPDCIQDKTESISFESDEDLDEAEEIIEDSFGNNKKERKKNVKKQKNKSKSKNNLSDSLKNLEKLKRKLERFWNLKCTVKTRRYLKKYIIGVFKQVGPRKIKGYVRYGFDEPDKTGKVTGYLSLMPFVYQKGFSLQPDFSEKVIECKVSLKGHFFLGYILRIVCKISLWKTLLTAKKYFVDNK